MHIRYKNCAQFLVTITSIIMLVGCTTSFRTITQEIPLSINVRVIEKNGLPVPERKIWCILYAPGLSSMDYYEWINKHIPNAFEAAGLRNYKITNNRIRTLNSSEVENDYLLVIILNNLKEKKVIYEKHKVPMNWLSLTTSIYDFPKKSLMARLGGSATASVDYDHWKAGEICSSLLREMMENMYSKK